MPGSTATYGLPYLEPDDAPDIAGATQALAEAVETELERIETTAPQPVEAFQGANDTSSSLSYVEGTQHGTSFTAPPSGMVYVTFGGHIGHNSAVAGINAYLSDIVRTGSTVGSGSTVAGMGASNERAVVYFGHGVGAGGVYRYTWGTLRHLVTGLTPGNPYNVTTVFRIDTAGATAAVDNRRLLIEPAM